MHDYLPMLFWNFWGAQNFLLIIALTVILCVCVLWYGLVNLFVDWEISPCYFFQQLMAHHLHRDISVPLSEATVQITNRWVLEEDRLRQRRQTETELDTPLTRRREQIREARCMMFLLVCETFFDKYFKVIHSLLKSAGWEVALLLAWMSKTNLYFAGLDIYIYTDRISSEKRCICLMKISRQINFGFSYMFSKYGKLRNFSSFFLKSDLFYFTIVPDLPCPEHVSNVHI